MPEQEIVTPERVGAGFLGLIFKRYAKVSTSSRYFGPSRRQWLNSGP